MANLLLELFSEEIPARMQAQAAQDLKRLLVSGLRDAGLAAGAAGAFVTPRRLALSIERLGTESRASHEERRGPRTDAPDAALAGFLRSTGLSRDQLTVQETPKGRFWFARISHPGRPAAEIVAEVLEHTIRNFPWPKSMRWGAGELRWIRPLHGILCILYDDAGATVVPFQIDNLRAGNTTRGHRFMAPDPFPVTSLDDYQTKLARAFVHLNAAERIETIRAEAANLAFAQGLEVVADEPLLAELAGLVEWPVVLAGRIPPQFLHLPPEVLQTSMREHQKFLSLRHPGSARIEGFITVANRDTADHGATILAGNQKVLAARLSDAAFFWQNDLREAKAGMTAWAKGLESVTFHNKLGSQAERIARIALLARELAPACGADPDLAERAARLAKLDLRSAMVGEFPELQGIMGRYYALEAGEPAEVADAVRDHWSPKGESDAVPTAPVSVAVALADRLDTLAGFWAIDEKPTGSKDPFALRRAALGVTRLIYDNARRLPLRPVIVRQCVENLWNIAKATTALEYQIDVPSKGERWMPVSSLEHFTQHHRVRTGGLSREVFEALLSHHRIRSAISSKVVDTDALCCELLAFLHDRLKVHLREQGIRHDVIDAVLALPASDDLVLVVTRAEALAAMLKTEDGENLLQGFRRANNILTQAEERDGVEYSFGADAKLAEDPTEVALFAALEGATARIRPALDAEDFATAMAAMAGLRAPLDAFFEAVQVNCDNTVLRRNRLNLLSQVRALCLQVADLGRIEG